LFSLRNGREFIHFFRLSIKGAKARRGSQGAAAVLGIAKLTSAPVLRDWKRPEPWEHDETFVQVYRMFMRLQNSHSIWQTSGA
jgi:hypothetical protein